MRLDQWMARENVGDEQLAQRISVTRATVSRLRRGKQRPSEALLQKLFAATLGDVAPNDFYDLPRLPVDAGEAA